jgi:hypothetical protein
VGGYSILVRVGATRKHSNCSYIFQVELTPLTMDACCRLPKRKATRENFIVSVLSCSIQYFEPEHKLVSRVPNSKE